MKLATYIGIATGAVALAGAAWAAMDFTGVRPALILEHRNLAEEVAGNSRALLHIRYQDLDRIRQQRKLTTVERQEFCSIARQLGWKGPGC